MTRTYCDICNTEIKPGELIATFSSMELNLMSGQQQPTVHEYVICKLCKIKFKDLIVENKKNA